jgi:hypothetical protein
VDRSCLSSQDPLSRLGSLPKAERQSRFGMFICVARKMRRQPETITEMPSISVRMVTINSGLWKVTHGLGAKDLDLRPDRTDSEDAQARGKHSRDPGRHRRGAMNVTDRPASADAHPLSEDIGSWNVLLAVIDFSQ